MCVRKQAGHDCSTRETLLFSISKQQKLHGNSSRQEQHYSRHKSGMQEQGKQHRQHVNISVTMNLDNNLDTNNMNNGPTKTEGEV